MVDAVGDVQTRLFSENRVTQGPTPSRTNEIDDTIEAYLQSGKSFEFTYKDNSYKITEEQGKYVAYDSNGKIVDPDVQINTKNTVDGFIEVRGLYGSGGNALYIGNDPRANNGEVLFIEESAFLDRGSLGENPHLATLLATAPDLEHAESELPPAVDLKQLASRINFDDTLAYQNDRDRSINIDELDAYLRYELGVTLSDDQLSEFFGRLDRNGSGNIREAELRRSQGGEPPAESRPKNDPSPEPTSAPDKQIRNRQPEAGEVVRSERGSVDAAGTRHNVSRTEKSPWSTLNLPEGTAEVQYESLDRPYKGAVSTAGADYILIIKSGGKTHNSIDNPQSFFGTRDGDLVGVTGSKDKGMMLIKVDDLDKIQMDTGDSSVQIMRIKTDETLTVLNDGSGALDNDLVRGGKGASREAINRLGYSIDHRRVEAWNDDKNFFTVYADDESKYDHRVKKYGDASEIFYYGGDDSAYLLPPGARADKKGEGSGNGAIIHIGVA